MDLSIAIKLAILGIHLQILSIGLYLKLGKSSFDTAFETKQANEIEFIPNEEFNSIYPNTQPIQQNTIENLEKLKGKIAFLPDVFGYNNTMGDQLFPPFTYPKCSIVYPPNPDNYVHLDYTNNQMSMNCAGDFKGKYVIGPPLNITFSNPIELFDFWKPKEYNGPVQLQKGHDFVIASCKTYEGRYELQQHYPRPNKQVFQQAYQKAMDFQLKTKVARKPLIVLMLTLDSFSRNHFFRKLPLTVQYLNDLNNSTNYRVFDFKLHNIIGSDTAENQSRVFGTKWQGKLKNFEVKDNFGKEAIWSKFKQKGFTTLLGFDPCAYKFHFVIGRAPNIDHVSQTFFCANSRLGGYTSHKRVNYQRCIGPYMAHYYTMNYTITFSQIYRGTNQWIYNHFGAAHEDTGQHANTLDDYLLAYLHSYIQDFGDDNNIVIFLVGDHGMRYGNYKNDIEAIQEHRLPAFFLIVKKQILNRIENSLDVLTHNTQRLTTKPDLRRTLEFLSSYPYNLAMDEPESKFLNLFQEKASDDRSCEDAEIPPWFCAQYTMKTIPQHLYDQSSYGLDWQSMQYRNLIYAIADQLVVIMNENSYSFNTQPLGQICRYINLSFIEQVLFHQNNEKLILRLILRVEQNLSAKIDAWIVITKEYFYTEFNTANFRSFPIWFDKKKLFVHIIRLDRVDKYGGACEEIARLNKIDPEYCFCTKKSLESNENYQTQQIQSSSQQMESQSWIWLGVPAIFTLVSNFTYVPVPLMMYAFSLSSLYIGCIRSLKLSPVFRHLNNETDEIKPMDANEALKFPLIASAFLVTLYVLVKFVNQDLVVVVLSAYFTLIGIEVGNYYVKQVIAPYFQSDWKYDLKIPAIPFVVDDEYVHQIDKPYLISCIFTIPFGIAYLLTRNWILNNIFALAFTIYGIENVSFGSFKNGGLLLILLFFYDIFWVFGSEVMVTVAKGLDVPIKFLFPKAIEGFSMLGLGDVVIPGAFIALALRFDYFIKDKKEGNANNYFNATFGSYPIALGVTIAVMYLFDSPQPALLYLVPGCLISLALVAIFKKQIDHVWIFSEE